MIGRSDQLDPLVGRDGPQRGTRAIVHRPDGHAMVQQRADHRLPGDAESDHESPTRHRDDVSHCPMPHSAGTERGCS